MKTVNLVVVTGVFLIIAFSACEGPMGPEGRAGNDGTSFVWMGEFASEADLIEAKGNPQNGWAYYNTTEKKAFIYNSLVNPPWQTLSEQGEKGDAGEKGDTGDKGDIGDKGDAGDNAYLIIFKANGGIFADNEDIFLLSTNGTDITSPTVSRSEYFPFNGWHTKASGGKRIDLTKPITANYTLYAHWSFSSLNDISSYLTTQTGGGNPDDPINLPVGIVLGTMTQAGSGWRNLLDVIEMAGKYIELDLSDCFMTGTEFNPDRSIETGKEYIVSVTLPSIADSIADGARWFPTFGHFASLRAFSAENIIRIGNHAFYGRGFNTLNLPDSLTYIGDFAFDQCQWLSSVTLPASATIGEGAFYLCNLANLTFTLTGTGSLAVSSGGKILIQDTTIVAASGSTGDVTIPNGITTIGCGAFSGCWSLDSIILPDSLTTIEDRAFSGCESLVSITLPASFTAIGTEVFYECFNLDLLICNAVTPPSDTSPVFGYGTEIFGYGTENTKIRVPAPSVSAYKIAWSNYADKISAIE